MGGPRVLCVCVTWKWVGRGGNGVYSISSESQPNVKNNSASLEAASIHCCAEAAVVLVPEPSLEHALCSSSEPILGWQTPRHSFLFSILLHCRSLHPSKASKPYRALGSPWLGCSPGGTPCPFRALICSSRPPVCQSPPSLFESGEIWGPARRSCAVDQPRENEHHPSPPTPPHVSLVMLLWSFERKSRVSQS